MPEIRLYVYEQRNSMLRWVVDKPLSLSEMLDCSLIFRGTVRTDDYENIGMGYYRLGNGYTFETVGVE